MLESLRRIGRGRQRRLSARMRRIKAGWFDWMGIDRLDREAYTAAVRSEFFGKFDADTRTEHAA